MLKCTALLRMVLCDIVFILLVFFFTTARGSPLTVILHVGICGGRRGPSSGTRSARWTTWQRSSTTARSFGTSVCVRPGGFIAIHYPSTPLLSLCVRGFPLKQGRVDKQRKAVCHYTYLYCIVRVHRFFYVLHQLFHSVLLFPPR